MLTVRGRAIASARADELSLAFEVTARREDAEEAMAEVAARTRTLVEAIEEHGVPAHARATAGLTLRPHVEYRPDGTQSQIGYQAWSLTSVRLGDLEVARRLTRAAVERAQANVDGPRWSLSDPGATQLEACRLAAADAVRRAHVYAEELGLRLGPIERVVEGSVGRQDGEHPSLGFSFGPLDVADREPSFDPGQVVLRAEVDVTYATEPA
jgi:uncharacterized protein